MKELVIEADRNNLLKDPLSVEITFIDNGKQYNPLAKPDPDITLSAKQRKKAGWASIWSKTAWTMRAMNIKTERIALP